MESLARGTLKPGHIDEAVLLPWDYRHISPDENHSAASSAGELFLFNSLPAVPAAPSFNDAVARANLILGSLTRPSSVLLIEFTFARVHLVSAPLDVMMLAGVFIGLLATAGRCVPGQYLALLDRPDDKSNVTGSQGPAGRPSPLTRHAPKETVTCNSVVS